MNKTQSIIFVIAVLALTILGNLLYINRPNHKVQIKKICMPILDDAIRMRMDYFEFVQKDDTLFIQFYTGNIKTDVDKTLYYLINNK